MNLVLTLMLLAATPRLEGIIWVTNETSGDVSVVDLQKRAVVATIRVGDRPRAVKPLPNGQHVLVTTQKGLALIDATTHKVIRVLPAGDGPDAVALSIDGSRAFVSNDDTGALSVVEIPSGKRLGVIGVGADPQGVTASPDGRAIYVTSEDQVTVVDAHTLQVRARVATQKGPRSVTFSPDGKKAWVTNEQSGSLTVIDAMIHVPLWNVSLPGAESRPLGAAISPDGASLFVTTGQGGALFVLDARTDEVQRVIEGLGQRTSGVVVSADGGWVVTANGLSNDVSVVSLLTGEVIARIPVGVGPSAVAFVAAEPKAPVVSERSRGRVSARARAH
jgi:YVTN family beta-propeller protein